MPLSFVSVVSVAIQLMCIEYNVLCIYAVNTVDFGVKTVYKNMKKHGKVCIHAKYIDKNRAVTQNYNTINLIYTQNIIFYE